jgi:hypothetical protein
VQDAVAAEALIDDTELLAASRDQAPCKLVGPAAECVVGRDVPVGNRVAERDDRADVATGQNIDST